MYYNIATVHMFQACPLNPHPDGGESMKKLDEFSECFTPAISSVVSFAKSIPGFQVFSQEDQVTLLKVSSWTTASTAGLG